MGFKNKKYAFKNVVMVCYLLIGFPTAHGYLIEGKEKIAASNPVPPQPRAIRPNPATLTQRPPARNTTTQTEDMSGSERASVEQENNQKEQTSEDRFVTIDFDNVDIDIFIKFIRTSRDETTSGRAFTNYEYKDMGVILSPSNKSGKVCPPEAHSGSIPGD